jgi:histidine triad (HIT) family protein
MTDCAFCSLVAGDLPARVVHESASTLAFLDTSPAAPGHTLVVPKVHVQDLMSAPPGVAGEVLEAAAEVARLLEARLPLAGVTLLQNNRRAGWQDVMHLHVHVVPRYDADALVRPWTPRRAKAKALDEVHAALV